MSVFTGRSLELVWIVVAACMLCSGLVTGDHVEGHTGSDNSSGNSFGQMIGSFLENLFSTASVDNNNVTSGAPSNQTDVPILPSNQSKTLLKSFLTDLFNNASFANATTDWLSNQTDNMPNNETGPLHSNQSIISNQTLLGANQTVIEESQIDGIATLVNATTNSADNSSVTMTTISNNETQLNKPPVTSSNNTSLSSANASLIDGSTTAPQTTATTTATVTTRAVVLDAGMQDDQCYSDALIQNFCEAPPGLHDLSMWDLYSIMFTETVLNALVISCPKGQWCIQDRFDYWEALIMERVDMVMNSDIAVAMCGPNADPCIEAALDNYLNCSTVYEKLKFTTLSVKLMCHLKQNPDLTTECYKHTLTALHVTLADIMREQTGDIDDVSGELCTSPSFHMTRALICITNDCPGETAGFERFKPWAWFYYVVDDLINRCDLDPNKCTALLTSTAQLVYQNEMRTMMGVSVVTMVSAMVLVTAMCFCYRRHRRHVVLKEGYEKLLNEGDES